MSIPVSDLQAIAPSGIIELFELQLSATLHGSSDVWRFHNGSNTNNNGQVVWAGNTYSRYPIACDGFEYSGQGTLPQPKLRVSNIFGTITALLLTANQTTPGNDLIGAKLVRIRTLAKYLDAVNFPGSVNPTADPTVEFPREIYFISQKSAETRDYVEFVCSSSFDLQGVRAPKRQCIANICQWVYRGTECGYSASIYYDASDKLVTNANQDVCAKRLSSCLARFGPIKQTGSITSGSTTLTLDTTANVVVGMPIYGFGVASGATISSITNSTTLVMSAAATATSTSTQTATPSATAAQMTVANGSVLQVGMTVTGTYIPSGTTITAISGNTVTLNQRPYSFSIAGTAALPVTLKKTPFKPKYVNSTYSKVNNTEKILLSSTSGISVNMKVFGSLGINTTVKTVTTNTSVELNAYPSGITNGAAINLFFMPASPSSGTYTFQTFTSNPTFTFRTLSGELPFGSFPAVGLYE